MLLTEQNADIEFDLAMLELKGNRYEKAEEMFVELTVKYNNADMWCGLGIAKMGRLLSNTTVEEVFYCFDKARQLAPEKESELEVSCFNAAMTSL